MSRRLNGWIAAAALVVLGLAVTGAIIALRSPSPQIASDPSPTVTSPPATSSHGPDTSVSPSPTASARPSPDAPDPTPAAGADPAGLIAFSRDGDVYAMTADGANLTAMVEDASTRDRSLAWLTDGTRLAVLSEPNDNPYVAELSLVDPDGANRTSLGTLQPVYSPPSWSPDGALIAFGSDGSSGHGISVFDLHSGELRQLTTDGGVGRDGRYGPVWSPDGARIAYLVNPGGDVWIVDVADGSRFNLSGDGMSLGPMAWVEVGGREYVVYDSYRGQDPNKGDHRTWIAEVDSGSAQPLAGSGIAIDPAIRPHRQAPDGRSSVLVDEDGRLIVRGIGSSEILPDGVVLLTVPGAELDSFGPTWSGDGSVLAFAGGRTGEGAAPAGGRDILLVRLRSGGEPVLANLTESPEDESAPAWQPADGG